MRACADRSIWACLMVQGNEGLKQQRGDQHEFREVSGRSALDDTAIINGNSFATWKLPPAGILITLDYMYIHNIREALWSVVKLGCPQEWQVTLHMHCVAYHDI
jgi:hypothetical protein